MNGRLVDSVFVGWGYELVVVFALLRGNGAHSNHLFPSELLIDNDRCPYIASFYHGNGILLSAINLNLCVCVGRGLGDGLCTVNSSFIEQQLLNFESSHQFKCWILFQLVDVQLSQRFHTKQATIIVRVITDIVKVKIR